MVIFFQNKFEFLTANRTAQSLRSIAKGCCTQNDLFGISLILPAAAPRPQLEIGIFEVLLVNLTLRNFYNLPLFFLFDARSQRYFSSISSNSALSFCTLFSGLKSRTRSR
uniref:(northern house mosquito) hypothetical protein n=1 Tax=Culex pipiens TaxID=7175 RepID=A0A8D8FJ02_CULPI